MPVHKVSRGVSADQGPDHTPREVIADPESILGPATLGDAVKRHAADSGFVLRPAVSFLLDVISFAG